MSKTKKILEWLVIGLFIAIVASIASIQIYRAVVNSDWYNERQTRKTFEQVVELINNTDNIKYIKVDDNTEERFIEEIPDELFDDISVKNYPHIEDVDKIHEIFRQGCITVFFKDRDTQISFFITDDGGVYWGLDLIVECPSLLNWYYDIIEQ